MNCSLPTGSSRNFVQVHLEAAGRPHRHQPAVRGRWAASRPQRLQPQSRRRFLFKNLRRKFGRSQSRRRRQNRRRRNGTKSSDRKISKRRFVSKHQAQSKQGPIQVVRPDHCGPQLQPLHGFLRPLEQEYGGSRLVRCHWMNPFRVLKDSANWGGGETAEALHSVEHFSFTVCGSNNWYCQKN